MLFNSFHFIGLFLPLTLAGWWLLKRLAGIRVALAWLVAASLFFYAMWDVRYLAVLLCSVGANFWLGGRVLSARDAGHARLAKRWMIAGVCFNLLVLTGFKYAYFLAASVLMLFDATPSFAPPLLPLAISFVTFQKIAYLVDCRSGLVEKHDLLDYLFFVSFFPQLIAGPIVHHCPLIAQTREADNPLFRQKDVLVAGLCFFAIGLCKKVILADNLARYASPVFSLAQHNIPTAGAAWQGMLAYTLQLYFDFSGYSDMAIGLALMFGFKLPVNFCSPYLADSVIEFWRRWHMTLSTFLRDYLYIPLGGNQGSAWRRYRNLCITMILAGLWHGAGWNFLLWGVLHGVLLLINHGWRLAAASRRALAMLALPKPLAVPLTFFVVALAWVVFRAPDLHTAWRMYLGLLQPGLFSLPALPPSAGAFLESFAGAAPDMGWLWIALALALALGFPCSVKMLSYEPEPNRAYPVKTNFMLGLLVGSCLWLSLKWMAVRPVTEFLYFNF